MSTSSSLSSSKSSIRGWRDEPPYAAEFGFSNDKNNNNNHDEIDEEVSSNTKTTTTVMRLASHTRDGHHPTDNTTDDKTTSTTTTKKNTNIYTASCYCGRVQYQVWGAPVRSKYCHCRACQQLHGAPFEWVSIFDKSHVRFPNRTSLDHLYFYNAELDRGWTSSSSSSVDVTNTNVNDKNDNEASIRPVVLPVKVSCNHCRTPIADEGRRMWLAFTTLFGFTSETGIPDGFQHDCHLFYSQRCVDLDMEDTAEKWQGHANQSARWKKQE